MLYGETKIAVNNKKTMRLVCPNCGEGFIKVNEPAGATDRHGFTLFGVTAPSCNNCGANFTVMIDKTLKITIERQ
jgi:predicted RNA-binding Zn-ribbon protein involved in translation (DUF1610 family)